MNRLQQLREAAGLSQAELGRQADVTPAVISRLEAGEQVAETDRVVLTPGEAITEDQAHLLSRLANALNGILFDEELTVTPAELLQPAREDLPVVADAIASPGDVTLPALPLIGVNFPRAHELPPEARSHNPTEQPDDIDAALAQLAKNAQVTASEEAVRLQPDAATTQAVVEPAIVNAPGRAEIPPAPPLTAQNSGQEVTSAATVVPANSGEESVAESPAVLPEPDKEQTGPTLSLAGQVEENTASPAKDPEQPSIPPPTPQPDPDTKANLGVATGEAVAEVPANPRPPLTPAPVRPPLPEKPAQDAAPLTTRPVPDRLPVMEPYIQPLPAEDAQSPYKLPTGTVITALIGVGAALGWYAWRAWRRTKTASERVAPYFKAKKSSRKS